jgi:hypothetical protein
LATSFDRPEALSGVWEAPDGQGGAVGIHLNPTTIVSDDVDPPAWTPQSWQNLNFGVFQRRGSALAILASTEIEAELRSFRFANRGCLTRFGRYHFFGLP